MLANYRLMSRSNDVISDTIGVLITRNLARYLVKFPLPVLVEYLMS